MVCVQESNCHGLSLAFHHGGRVHGQWMDVLLVHPELLAYQRCGGEGAVNCPNIPCRSYAPVVIGMKVGEKIVFGQRSKCLEKRDREG